MLQTTPRTIREDVLGDVASQELTETDLVLAKNNFWHFRVLINSRLTLNHMWFPRSLACRLRTFHEDYKAGKRPVMLLCTPPQHGKSLSVIDYIAWAVGQDPNLRVIYSSFSDRLGIRANLRLQRTLDSKVYRRVFPETRLSSKHIVTLAEHYLRNHEVLEFAKHEGYFRNTTVLGSITGEALDLAVIDDPIKGRAEAQSELQRDKAWNWMTDDVLSRFSEKAALIMIMTRWHVDDPAGRMIEHFGNRVQVVRYPALAEGNEFFDGKCVRRPGDPLFPELKSLEFLSERRKLYTQASWEALYQQNPIIVGGGMFPIDKITIDPVRPALKNIAAVARYWDKAGTADGGAYSAGVLMARMRDGTYVIVDVRRGQWSALDRERVIKQTAIADHQLYAITKIYVEQEPGSGGKESAEASVRMLAGYSVEADRVSSSSGSKEVRADPFAAQWQAGNVRLVAAPWNRDYIDEHEQFPSGKYKDQVDASSGAFNKIISKYRYDSTLAWVG